MEHKAKLSADSADWRLPRFPQSCGGREARRAGGGGTSVAGTLWW